MRAATVIACGTLAAGLASAAAGAPESAAGGPLEALRERGCPPYRALAQKEYSDADVRAARRGRFTIYKGLTARLDPPVNWKKNPHHRRGFRSSLQTLQFLDVLFYAYRQGRDGALRQAKRLALDWVRQNRGPDTSQTALAWMNKNVGERAPYLGYALRAGACERILDRRQRLLLLGSIRTHGDWLDEPVNYYGSNHGLFMDLGLLVLADRYFPFLDAARGWEARARDRFPRTLDGRTSAEGAWLEHSPGYHFLVMDLARRFIELGGPDGRVGRLLRALGRAAPWFVMPDGRLTQLGDTELDPAPKGVRRRAKERSGAELMRRAGFAFVRAGRSYLSVAAGFHSKSHKHSDELTFELFEDGTRIVVGPGRYGYDRDRRRRFVLSSRAHSVLTVGGRDFPRDPRLAYGGAIDDVRRQDGWFVIVGHNPLLRLRGVAHRRVFLYKPGQALVIEDRVESGRRHRYKRYLHLGPEIDVQPNGPSELTLRGERFRGCLEDARYADGKRAERQLVRGRENPFQGYTFPQVAEPPVPRWSVALSSRAHSVRHVLALDLRRSCGPAGALDLGDEVADLLDRILGPLLPERASP